MWIKQIDYIRDTTMKKVMTEFLENNDMVSVTSMVALVEFVKNKKISELSSNAMCEYLNLHQSQIKIVGEFYKFAYAKEYINDQYTHFLKLHSYVFDNLTSYKSREELYFRDSNPTNIRIYKNKKGNEFIYLPFENMYLKSVCDDFLVYLSNTNKYFIGIRSFLRELELSLGSDANKIKRIKDFNEKTLEIQFDYYKKSENKFVIQYLKWFYVFLLEFIRENHIDHKLFKMGSGIDEIYLKKLNFAVLFNDGYRVVYLNKVDSIPINDKWLVAPNGIEERSTTHKHNDYFPIDFTRIENKDIRKLIKKYVWTKDFKLKELNNSSNRLIKFFEFFQARDLSSNNVLSILDGIQNDSILTAHNILTFKEYMQLNYTKEMTINGYLSTVRGFANFLEREGFFIDPLVFQYLAIRKVYGERNKTISEKDLKKISDEIMRLMDSEESKEKLFSICVYLMLTTNLRASTITSLETNCIKEGIKQEEYIIDGSKVNYSSAISAKTKTSNGGYKEENPSEYAIRALEIAIEITNDIRLELKEEDKALKKYIFLKKETRFDKIDCIDVDFIYRRFKKMLSEIGMDRKYTLNDCRHTYMTELFRKAIDGGNF